MQGQEHLGQFSSVDDAANPRDFVALLDQLLLQAGERKRRTYDLMEIRPGNHVLDVGCGTGADVRALGEIVGPNGLAVGVDHSHTMVSEARKRCEGIELSVGFKEADAADLPFSPAAFDACRCERILEHVKDPDLVVSEMARVVKPGGRVVVYEPDWGTTAIDFPDPVLSDRVTSFLAQSVQNGRVGRQLRRLFRRAGLGQIQVDADVWTVTDFDLAARLLRLEDALRSARTAGVITADEADAFISWGRDANEHGYFLGSLTFFYGIGVKPAA